MKAIMCRAGSIRVLILFSIIILSGAVLLASAVTPMPNEFSGSVTLNGKPAPIGTTIEAFIDGYGYSRGNITVVSAGKYVRLSVAGDSSDDGMDVRFTVGGLPANETGTWIAWIDHGQNVDLTAGDTPVGDITSPDIAITSPTSGAPFTTATITVSGTASDDVALDSVKVKVGSGDWEDASGTLTSWSKTVTLDLGPNTIYAMAVDTSEHSKEVHVEVNYVVESGDTTPPNVTITSPSQGAAFTTATITVSGTASDDVGLDSVKVRVGSGSWEAASGTTLWSKTVTLSMGLNTIDVRAIDTTGNSSETASITVAYNPPTDGGSSGGFAPSSGATPTGAATPVPGETVTPAPSMTPTTSATPAATPAKEPGAEEPEKKKGLLPGFEAVFAIAGLLAVAYLASRRRR